ncbi:competence protein CoiA family protein [Rhodoferax bucti]|uniref:competence protein CoiA family protein n=1 Tax=Rhodoferax bucti TaxID=2576305 RepID=UPI001476E5EB|nr:competence protein CoiA family protein [Rhodoferax bucti]
MSLRVPFGLKESTLYEPNGVPNGKACGCVCPACKRPLIARQGAATPHFAHAPGEDCARGFETAVHLAAKQIIAERKEVRLPIVEYQSTLQYAPSKVHTAERLLRLDEVELEVWMSNIRPDIWVKAGDERYLVEIAVTHFVDEEKNAKIRELRIPAFEVNLKSLKDCFTFTALERTLFSSPYPAIWIFNEHIEAMTAEAQQLHTLESNRQREIERQAKIEFQRIESRRVQRALERAEKFRRYRNMPPLDKLERNIRQLGLTEGQMKKFSTFVPWELSFSTPREVWQSAVLVYIARVEKFGPEEFLCIDFEHEDCLAWLRLAFEVKPQVPNGDSIALWKYLKHLETLGVLKQLRNKFFAIKIGPTDWTRMFPHGNR